MGPFSCALQLIKSSPNLSELENLVYSSRNNAEAVLKYLDTPSCLERPLAKLEYAAINHFMRSKAIAFSRSISAKDVHWSGDRHRRRDCLRIDAFLQSFSEGRATYSQRKAMLTKLICVLRV